MNALLEVFVKTALQAEDSQATQYLCDYKYSFILMVSMDKLATFSKVFLLI